MGTGFLDGFEPKKGNFEPEPKGKGKKASKPKPEPKATKVVDEPVVQGTQVVDDSFDADNAREAKALQPDPMVEEA